MPMLPELVPYLLSLPRDPRWVVTMPVSEQQPHASQQLTRNALLKRLKRVLKKLKLKGHLHTFRHSFISFCVLQKTPEALIRTWVGHVDTKIMRRYTHINCSQSQEAMLGLSKVVKKPSEGNGGESKKSA